MSSQGIFLCWQNTNHGATQMKENCPQQGGFLNPSLTYHPKLYHQLSTSHPSPDFTKRSPIALLSVTHACQHCQNATRNTSMQKCHNLAVCRLNSSCRLVLLGPVLHCLKCCLTVKLKKIFIMPFNCGTRVTYFKVRLTFMGSGK